ncbi:hypothetical protein F5884DRAFT_659083 [Xylogone sp. PMI_703]|nr:hypothetical protein F5884DRAFT_659083 [Xylogone sp. PMI_703]
MRKPAFSTSSRDLIFASQFLLASTSTPSLHPLLPQRRHASTAPSKALKHASPSALETRNKINGPLTTLPAPLTLPTRSPNQSTFPYLLSLGKAYLNFYKTGVKSIYVNFKAARPIQQTIDTKYRGDIRAAVNDGYLTRSDFQLLARNSHDVKRVPIFALVFLICGEMTPLVVIALSGVVPWTCRIPKQIDSDRRKIEERRRSSFRELTMEPPVEAGVEKLARPQLRHISSSLGLSARMWDWVGGLPSSLLRIKLRHRLEYLKMDDLLIASNGGVAAMDIEEVKLACVDRGIDVLGRPEAQLRMDLSSWLRSREKAPMERLLLTR